MIANMAQWAAIFGRGGDDDEGQNPLVLIATMIIAPIAAAIIQMAISRAREYMADDEGGRMIDDPLALARALAKIDNYAHYRVMDGATNSTAHMFIINPLSGLSGGLQTLFSTHPSTESRIQKLQELDRKLHGR
jgi:heat shock protein HtpX